MIRSTLRNLNKKFDSVKDPNRFLIFIGMMIPGSVLIATENAILVSIGAIWLLLMLTIRAMYIYGDL